MTTYTITGYGFQTIEGVQQSTTPELVVVLGENQTDLSYQYYTTFDTLDERSLEPEFSLEPLSTLYDGVNLDFEGTYAAHATLTWNSGANSAQLLGISFEFSDDFMVFELGGDELDSAILSAFGNPELFAATAELGPITSGPFAPGAILDLGLAVGLTSISEDDVVTDIFGADFARLGAGEDFYSGLDGSDVVNFGGGFDTASYADDANAGGGSAIIAQMADGKVDVVDGFSAFDVLTKVEMIRGTMGEDVVTSDGTQGILGLQGLAGDDLYIGHAGTYDILDYSFDADYGGTNGIIADLYNGVVNDGWGDLDTVSDIDEVVGSQQDDYFYASSGDVALYGRDGNDTFYGDTGSSDVYGGEDIDLFSFEYGTMGVKIQVGRGVAKSDIDRDTFDSIEAFIGTDFDDVFAGTNLDDIFYGLDGADIIRVKGGTNFVSAGNGDDRIYSDGGQDEIYGGNGNDLIKSGGGIDTIYAGADDDIVRAGGGDDIVYGETGEDTLFGNGGKDYIDGGDQNDRIEGGSGADTLIGGAGDDVLKGDSDGDILFGGMGDDRLYGGTERDTFQFKDLATMGNDKIKDWEDGLDTIDFFDQIADFDAAYAIAENQGDFHMKFDFGGGNLLLVENFRKEDFDASDVAFSEVVSL
jgi:hypothetical protein